MHFFSYSPKKTHILGKAISSWCCSCILTRGLAAGSFETLESFLSIPVLLLSQTKWFISKGLQSVMHMVLLSCLLPHLSCSCGVMCLLPRFRCAFPSTDVWSLVSPARGLVLSVSLSINSDAFSSVCWSPRDLTRTCAIYWWLCWPTYPPHPSDF